MKKNKPKLVSLFSGVGGFDLGLEQAGMEIVAQVEWDKHCQDVLKYHWPDTPLWGDISKLNGKDIPNCDIVAFGSPCQDLSSAGLKAGLSGDKSNLFFEATRVIEEMSNEGNKPTFIIWENVVGSLSSNKGNDFRAVINKMAELGAVDVQWRVLDAQYFGVPQRRRRVFLIAILDPRATSSRAILPESASVRRTPSKNKETWQEVASTLGGGSGSRGWSSDTDRMTFIPDKGKVRRLTPLECERIMGWPDNWTLNTQSSTVADSHRYRMCGNGVCAPVAQAIGKRIVDRFNSLS